MALVLLPCDLPTWPTVQRHLTAVKDVTSGQQLVQVLHALHNLCSVSLDPVEEPEDPRRFDGLLQYLQQQPPAELERLFRHILPCMVNYALKLKILKPPDGLTYSLQQQAGTVELDRRFIASLLANCFFSTFPKRSSTSHPTLLDANFSSFFYYLRSPWQRAKLEAVLLFFEAMSEAEPAGVVAYTRKVMSGRQFGSLAEWLSCAAPLCPLVVRDAGRIEDAEPGVSQVCFLSAQPATDVLRHSRSQEAICAVTHPELLAAPVFLERLEDNETFSVSGCVCSSRLVPPAPGAPTTAAPQVTRVKAPERRHFCGLDAECYRRLPAAQYDEDAVLRELNKSFLAFQQPGIAKRLSPIGESTCASRRGSSSPEPGPCAGAAPQAWDTAPQRLAPAHHSTPPPAEAAKPPAAAATATAAHQESPQPRPATIGGPPAEPPGGDSGNSSAGGATRQGVLRLISQLQHSIGRELGQAGQQANSQIVSQLMERLRTMERGRLVRLLSGAADVPADDDVSDDASLLTVCEALAGQPAELTPLDGDYFDWRLEELAQERGCCQPLGVAAQQRSAETDLFLSACSSVDSRSHSLADSSSEASSGSAAAARWRGSISPERAPPPPPRRRSTFRERLREADSRAERELKRDPSEDAKASGTPAPPPADAPCRSTPLICRRTGSLLASSDAAEEAGRLSQRSRSPSPSVGGNSSRLSFSSDFSSEVAQLCDRFDHWLEEPGGALAARDLAVLRLTQRLLRRTLSDGCADLALRHTARPPPPSCAGAHAEAASARARGGPVRSLSLSDPRARQRLVLELARRLVEPADNPSRQAAGQDSLPSGDGARPVATGNWGCGRRQGGDPQLKAAIQWLGASRAELPCLVYYTSAQPALNKLQWVCGSVSARQWTVGELAAAVLAHCRRRLERAAARPGAPEASSTDLFEELLRHQTSRP